MSGHPQGWSRLVSVSFIGRRFIGVYRQFAGGLYDLQIRPTYRGRVGQPRTIFAVGVGEVFITAGQSNATNSGDPTGFLPDLRVSAFDSGSGNGLGPGFPLARWRWGYDPQPVFDRSNGGSVWPKMASNLAAATGLPIGIYSIGQGSTAIAEWQPGHPLYDRLTTALIYFKYRGGVRAVLWDQGETDTGLHTNPAVYEAQLRRLIAQSRMVAGVPVKWMVAQAAGFSESNASLRMALRQAQANVVDGELTFGGPNTDLLGFPYRKASPLNPAIFPHFNSQGVLLLGSLWGISIFNTPGFLDQGALPVR
ncbi:sialate O-acetylesterase [Tundrisphaera lichenicola]|uniref:sialate O-acetylesterase n=1 Tax=Tundrisphaera lichenicola TaxID=2029860 RepID=UPI003EB6F2F7